MLSLGTVSCSECLQSSAVADIDEASKQEIKTLLLQYDRTLLVSDPRRCEPKKCAPSLLLGITLFIAAAAATACGELQCTYT